MTQVEPWIISLLWAGALAGVVWYCGRAMQRMTYVTLADGRRQERRLPTVFRLLLPFAPNVEPFFERPFFTRARRDLDRRITTSGFEGLLGAGEFLALRLLLLVMGAPVAVVVLRAVLGAIPGAAGSFLWQRQLLLHAAALVYLGLYPDLWLRRVQAARYSAVERALPFVLDLMTLSVEAGLDFLTAMRRIVERRNPDPLGEELLRMLREIQIGKTRREALLALATRCGQPDVRALVSALVQSDELGVSIGTVLRIQAEQMRQRRFQRAEKMAQQAPVKMLLPLVLFIFPCVFIVLLGPILMQFLRHGF